MISKIRVKREFDVWLQINIASHEHSSKEHLYEWKYFVKIKFDTYDYVINANDSLRNEFLLSFTYSFKLFMLSFNDVIGIIIQ